MDALTYLSLYEKIGQSSRWPKRNIIEIENILYDTEVDIVLLYLDEEIIGLCELSRHKLPDIEMKYFGLLPHFIGQKLRSFFLDQILRFCWTYRPNRIWWHVVDCDHPNAINTYKRARAHIYKQEEQELFDLETIS